jgi:hypothetical protein
MALRLGEYQRDIRLNKSGARQELEDFKQARNFLVEDIKRVSITSNDLTRLLSILLKQYASECKLWLEGIISRRRLKKDARLAAYVFFNCLESHSSHSEQSNIASKRGSSALDITDLI